MARFRGVVQGGRGSVSRLGHSKSGISLIANGWHNGIRVNVNVNDKDEEVFTVYKTGGSNASKPEEQVYQMINGEDINTIAEGA